ncbi:MAG: GNAT family N-acetyltransferase [Reyranella sp.]|uniref:GNAT family N-acetyltransferase n=1 Tax=Reyranella sp. TaxID=1929291 RepID=UPI001AC7E91F|nr:GNAT family N-acetyltransferase [Reyranella sp.]MBN9086907.1 GNAT family N-acetyltransferase [Reyranella sp.]
MSGFEIATASADDVLRIMGWAKDEGWNPANTDWIAFHAADPGAFLMGRLEGEPVACISVVRYGAGFGFLGCYIARPVVRGRGYGIEIWNAGMKRLDGRNVGLDGVPAQQANYRKSGYRLAWNNARHEGMPAAAPMPAGIGIVDARSLPFDKLAAYDRRFFPEPRDSFLAPWITAPERTARVALKDGEIVGFGVTRAAVTASRIGPLYAASPELAAALIGELAAAIPGRPVAVDMPDFNAPGIRLAEQLGLKPAFETARMYTGPDPAIDRAGLFGVTSLEFG